MGFDITNSIISCISKSDKKTENTSSKSDSSDLSLYFSDVDSSESLDTFETKSSTKAEEAEKEKEAEETEEQKELKELQDQLEAIQKKIENTTDQDELVKLKAQQNSIIRKIEDINISNEIAQKNGGCKEASYSGCFTPPSNMHDYLMARGSMLQGLLHETSGVCGGYYSGSSNPPKTMDEYLTNQANMLSQVLSYQQEAEKSGIIQSDSSNSVQAPVTNTIDPKLAAALDKKLGAGFSAKVEQVSANINCNPNDLIGMMQSESGLNPKTTNGNGGATGLIQFMPSIARGLGTTTEALRNMSAIEQMDYVEKYFKNNKKCYLSPDAKLDGGTLYTLCFLPAYSKKDVLCTSGSKYYKWNSGLDTNKDGSITKSDLSSRVSKKYQEAYSSLV